jgi:thiol-disulfide isomerase/thioredoxin
MPLRLGSKLPSLATATEWLNGDGSLISGQPVLIHFWAIGCGYCEQHLPLVQRWRDEFKAQGLQVIAVHMPLRKADTDFTAVLLAADAHDITEPCALDNQHKLRFAFKNEPGYVPAYYLFDANGKLKSRAAGLSGVKIIQAALQRLFAHPTSDARS